METQVNGGFTGINPFEELIKILMGGSSLEGLNTYMNTGMGQGDHDLFNIMLGRVSPNIGATAPTRAPVAPAVGVPQRDTQLQTPIFPIAVPPLIPELVTTNKGYTQGGGQFGNNGMYGW